MVGGQQAGFRLDRLDHQGAFFDQVFTSLLARCGPIVHTGQQKSEVQSHVGPPWRWHESMAGGFPIPAEKFEGDIRFNGRGQGHIVHLCPEQTAQVLVQSLWSSDAKPFHIVPAAEVLKGMVDQFVKDQAGPIVLCQILDPPTPQAFAKGGGHALSVVLADSP